MKRGDDLVGRRVKIVSLSTFERRIRPGSRGTVRSVDQDGKVWVAWDNGAGLALLPADRFRLLPSKKIPA